MCILLVECCELQKITDLTILCNTVWLQECARNFVVGTYIQRVQLNTKLLHGI